MFVELPFEIIVVAGGAFLLGWLLSAISSSIGARSRARKRDPRDDRIRSLDAELRVAKTEASNTKTQLEEINEQLSDLTTSVERRDNVISDQQAKIEKLNRDLKESVLKTRELRSELSERATENVYAEAKIREVQTELSVAQASTDMIATGVLDYSVTSNEENSDIEEPAAEMASAGASKAANKRG